MTIRLRLAFVLVGLAFAHEACTTGAETSPEEGDSLGGSSSSGAGKAGATSGAAGKGTSGGSGGASGAPQAGSAGSGATAVGGASGSAGKGGASGSAGAQTAGAAGAAAGGASGTAGAAGMSAGGSAGKATAGSAGAGGSAGKGTGGSGGTAGSAGAAGSAGPECTQDAQCPGTGRGCFEGLCRDKCFPVLDPCDWSPSGNVCQSGYCVECASNADCPGTRYACDTATHTCKDKPFDPTKTKIGVFYHTWHCPSAKPVYDVTKCLAGQTPWPAWPSDPNVQTSFWWGEPVDGYYCLTDDTPRLTKHAEMLRDMGADFVFVDITNHNYNTAALCAQPEEMILQPLAKLVEVWKKIPGAPKVVPWVPVSDCPTYLSPSSCNQPDSKYMVYSANALLKGSGLEFSYQGKPLLLVTENSTYPVSDARLAALSSTYTVRKMWAFEPPGTEKWSYLERCSASPLKGQPCGQRISVKGGAPEQLAIATAYGADYMSHTNTATPKHYGKTFRKQFQALLDNPETPIATITGWNEWVVGRWHCGSPACDCNNAFDKANGCFLDQYTDEYNRDIEPSKTKTGDYYYKLAQGCISLFRSGQRCTKDNASHVCCADYTGPM